MQPWDNFSQCEYAWTSFQKPAKLYRFDNRTGDKIHPTQKPVALYKWLFSTFAKKGMRVLDTHGGSMSSAVAAHELGLDMDICEINDFYFEKGKARVEKAMRQPMLF